MFAGFDWRAFIYQKMEAPYIPDVKSADDISSNYNTYPESDKEVPCVIRSNDPFLSW